MKKVEKKPEIPIHDFTHDDESSVPFKCIPLELKTKYDTSVPHRHNYYEIFIFCRGGGLHQVDFNSYSISSLSIHFVSPGQVHCVKRNLGSYGHVILFSRDFYYLNSVNKDVLSSMPFLNNNSGTPVMNLEKKGFMIFQDLVDKIKDEFRSEGGNELQIIRSYLDIFLLKCREIYVRNRKIDLAASPDAQIAQRFRTMVETNFRNLHLVKEYAEYISVSSDKLNEIVRKETGFTASRLIQDRIILEAKRLLSYSELSSKEIAYFLHYEDPSYFSRFFKSKTGLSPESFRKDFG